MPGGSGALDVGVGGAEAMGGWASAAPGAIGVTGGISSSGPPDVEIPYDGVACDGTYELAEGILVATM